MGVVDDDVFVDDDNGENNDKDGCTDDMSVNDESVCCSTLSVLISCDKSFIIFSDNSSGLSNENSGEVVGVKDVNKGEAGMGVKSKLPILSAETSLSNKMVEFFSILKLDLLWDRERV